MTQKKYDLIRLATNSLDQAVVATDMNGYVAFVNAAYTRLIGHEPADIIGRKVSESLPDFGDMKARLAHALSTLNTEGAYKGDILVCDQQGESKWVTMTANVVTDDNDQSRYIVATISDVTFSKIHETLQHRLLHDLVQGMDLKAMMGVVCQEVQQLLPNMHMSVALISETGRMDLQAAPQLPAWYCREIDGLEIGPVAGSCGTAAWSGEPVNVADIRTDPLWAPFRELAARLDYRAVWSIPIKGGDGIVKGVFAFYSLTPITPNDFHWHIVDICGQLCALVFERMEAKERVHFLAHRDSLTGLHNRGYFHQELNRRIAAARLSGTPFAMHLIDLDSFKEINDRYGHLAGDALLVSLAGAFGSVVAEGDTLARLGGDEFALLQADVSSPAAARRRAARLIEVAGAALHTDDGAITTGASIGYALFPGDAGDPENLMRNADLALYKAKHSGRGKACAYDVSMTSEIERRRRLEDDLRAVLAGNGEQLHLVYQPQFRLEDNMLVGFEALARWRHPELGLVSPETFIPIAEQGGLIGELGAWVLRQACLAARAWPGELRVAVNLSPVQLNEGDLPLLVHSLLLETGLSPKRLEIEVTENLLIEDKNRALQVLRRLSAMGICIALDDFGTGYASLSYLHFFPFDKIKIDRSFVMNLEENAHSRAIVDAVLGMCKAIGIPVIAEGIETPTQLAMLKARHCGYGQGYFLSPPLEDVAPFLALPRPLPGPASCETNVAGPSIAAGHLRRRRHR
ncbi:MAG: EAL domain-containing protein [Sphingomonas sp.]|uniref:sensor domain-containing protein n=1 Tax=Sphingomonas sp. TaxID=28214 RepID=UPI003564F62A